ncbi:MAG: DUF2520 domain-containing protein [Bacteroidales bacterium]|nr:DUF2520 domain-containing protein [Bacteroidales bacterium]
MNIVFIGAGNLATNLSLTLKNAGFSIVQIYSRTEKSAKELAQKIDCDYTIDINNLKKADIYFFSVGDKIIPKLLECNNFENKFIVHTAGSISIDVFKNITDNYGVFYPLQTFFKERIVDFKNIPICIEANNLKSLQLIEKIANDVSNDVRLINSDQRKIIHLAAVFACNFVNHLYSISADILNKGNIPFDILKPLIIETANKIIDNDPQKVQTGPAVRNDAQIIEKHLKMLDDDNLKNIYRLISDDIFRMMNK